jgi:hypothetical protein
VVDTLGFFKFKFELKMKKSIKIPNRGLEVIEKKEKKGIGPLRPMWPKAFGRP